MTFKHPYPSIFKRPEAQQALAKAAGMCGTTINKVLEGSRKPKCVAARRLVVKELYDPSTKRANGGNGGLSRKWGIKQLSYLLLCHHASVYHHVCALEGRQRGQVRADRLARAS